MSDILWNALGVVLVIASFFGIAATGIAVCLFLLQELGDD